MEDETEDRIGKLAAKVTGMDDEGDDDQLSAYSLWGGMLLMIGLGIGSYALFGYETTAPYSDTLNLGLLNEQLIVAIAGGMMFLGGVITLGLGGIADRLDKPR